MILNDRKDLDNAPEDVRARFMDQLAASINRWEWRDSEWKLVQDDSTIVKFGFTTADFAEPPVPEKPDYNPDERKREQEAKEIRAQRDALLADSDWTQVGDAPVDRGAWATYRQALRDIPQQEGFPDDVTWPEKPE